MVGNVAASYSHKEAFVMHERNKQLNSEINTLEQKLQKAKAVSCAFPMDAHVLSFRQFIRNQDMLLEAERARVVSSLPLIADPS